MPTRATATARGARAGKAPAAPSQSPQQAGGGAGADRRTRLMLAMIDAVGEQGYEATSVADVISRARLSRKSFYEQFPNKRACLLAAADFVVAISLRRVEAAYDSASDWPERGEAGLRALFESARDHPASARLALIDVAAAGEAGVERRERTIAEYARFLWREMDLDVGSDRAVELVLRAIVGGVNGVLHRRLLRGQHAGLPDLVGDLMRWAAAYYPIRPAGLRAIPGTLTGTACPPAPDGGGRAPGTLVPHTRLSGRRGLARGDQNVSRSYVVHNQRERLLDAVANLTAARGYARLTIEDVAEDAAVSQTAFYEHFAGKEDAFLVAYEVGHGKCLAAVERAYFAQPDWHGGVREGVRALFGFLSGEPAFARLALIDAPTASPRSAQRADVGLTAFARMLVPRARSAGDHPPAADVTIEAVAAGIFELCLHHALCDELHVLPELAPLASYFALLPFLGDEAAARTATAGRAPRGGASLKRA